MGLSKWYCNFPVKTRKGRNTSEGIPFYRNPVEKAVPFDFTDLI